MRDTTTPSEFEQMRWQYPLLERKKSSKRYLTFQGECAPWPQGLKDRIQAASANQAKTSGGSNLCENSWETLSQFFQLNSLHRFVGRIKWPKILKADEVNNTESYILIFGLFHVTRVTYFFL